MTDHATTPAPSAMTEELRTALQAILSARDDEEEYEAMVKAQHLLAQPVAAAPVEGDPFANVQVFKMAKPEVGHHTITTGEFIRLSDLRAALQQRQAPAQADLLGEVIGEVKELTCAPHPVGYTAKEARMFNLGFYAGTSLAVEKIAERKALAQQAEAAPTCGWKDCPHGAECVHAKAEAAPVASAELVTRESALIAIQHMAYNNSPGRSIYAAQLLVAAPVAQATPAPTAEPVRLPAIVATWLSSEAERRRAIAAHNAAFIEASKEPWPGRDIDAEYQVMNTAQNAEHRARMAMADELLASPHPISTSSTPSAKVIMNDGNGTATVMLGPNVELPVGASLYLASPSPHPVSIGAGDAVGRVYYSRHSGDYEAVIYGEVNDGDLLYTRAAHPSPEGGAAEAMQIRYGMMKAAYEAEIAVLRRRTDIAALVNRFLGWPLPDGLCPGVERPIGTHLMSADQAKVMFTYCLAATPSTQQETDK